MLDEMTCSLDEFANAWSCERCRLRMKESIRPCGAWIDPYTLEVILHPVFSVVRVPDFAETALLT